MLTRHLDNEGNCIATSTMLATSMGARKLGPLRQGDINMVLMDKLVPSLTSSRLLCLALFHYGIRRNNETDAQSFVETCASFFLL